MIVTHAGTSRVTDGRLVADGGRVLNRHLTRHVGGTRHASRFTRLPRAIVWADGFYRRDIGAKRDRAIKG